ncbi:hypothetical protein LX36DRAFT_713795 [Colletotrichum falcatum]|nr:hypothetical protein LX36DRAFT_713795 [Colletotrichum falcatum]
MTGSKQSHGSGRKPSSNTRKGSRHGPSTSSPSSSSSQQQQASHTQAQQPESERRPRSIKTKKHHAEDTGSSPRSWHSIMGSADEGYSGPSDRLYDVQHDYQQRQDHARNLAGPAPPSRERPNLEEQMYAFDSRFVGYQHQHTATDPTFDQFGEQSASAYYPQDVDLDDP